MEKSTHRKTVILDSNIWISYHLIDDIFHFESKRLIHHYFALNYQIVIPRIVFYETCNVISQYANLPNIISQFLKLIQRNANCQILDLSNEEYVYFLQNFASKLKMKTLDFLIYCCYVKIKPIKFITYDKKFLNIINKFSYEKKNSQK